MSSVSDINGVGEKTSKLLNKLGVYTVEDILLFFPRTYLIYPDLTEITEDSVNTLISFVGRIKSAPKQIKIKRGLMTSFTAYCDDNPVDLVWFNSSYIRNCFEAGKSYVFYGRLQKIDGKLKMTHPQYWDVLDYANVKKEIHPIYNLTKGLNNNSITKAVRYALENCKINQERLPLEIVKKYGLIDYEQAIKSYHFPKEYSELVDARRRLAFEELFFFVLNTKIQEEDISLIDNEFKISHSKLTDDFVSSLDFTLTEDQNNVIKEISNDLAGPYISQRLIQGDVGSGKTIVAFCAMLDTVLSGYQAAIMAPTEVLARQHYATFIDFVKMVNIDIPVVLFTGSMKVKEKKEAQRIVDENKACFIIGTHALISDGRTFDNLALVITDEQHRFGVKQRQALSQKGGAPHSIVMSATPIPRTLAMILYGNMHVSLIKQMPSNRLPIKTCVIGESKRATAFNFITKELASNHQVYIICPLVEATETTDAQNVIDYASKLKSVFKDVEISYLHGKMKAAEKNQIMSDFSEGKIKILVSTTVIEVGVNVPNATAIMIENANRFGLAALHQLRGRVGRGSFQSYCILMNAASGKDESKRLDVMLKSNDGFYIAKEDLKLRGPGDLFGVRQSGEFSFKIADIYDDADDLLNASKEVDEILKKDPKLKYNPALRSAMASFLTNQSYVL